MHIHRPNHHHDHSHPTQCSSRITPSSPPASPLPPAPCRGAAAAPDRAPQALGRPPLVPAQQPVVYAVVQRRLPAALGIPMLHGQFQVWGRRCLCARAHVCACMCTWYVCVSVHVWAGMCHALRPWHHVSTWHAMRNPVAQCARTQPACVCGMLVTDRHCCWPARACPCVCVPQARAQRHQRHQRAAGRRAHTAVGHGWHDLRAVRRDRPETSGLGMGRCRLCLALL